MIRRLRRLDRRWLDRAIAALFLLAGEIELFARTGTPEPQTVAILAAGYLTVLWRRSRPVVAGAAMLSLWVLFNLADDIQWIQGPMVGALVMGYAMGAYSHGREARIAPFVILAGTFVVTATWEDNVVTDFVFPTAFVLIAWLAGRGVRTRTRLTEELHEAAVRAKEAHDEEVARAAADERRRIAREMHDVVAHSVSVMVVQAGGARRILERDPARAVEAARRIEETGRAAMVEMRTLLGILHIADEEGVRAPQPTLQHLGALVAHAREAGLPVELREEGEPRALPAGIDLAAYRIVQEGLTNAIKHAGSPTQVTVRWGEHDLVLTIADRGPGPARVAAANGGHGLVGMAERVRIYGGELETGRRRGGGFEVTARLPL